MKNLTRKLMLSIVAIALVVIALGTSTFAWFTLSNKASVGQFNAEVTAGEGMELSLDGTTWYSNIPSNVIQAKIASDFAAAEVNGLKPVLSPVTTDALSTLSFKKMDVANKAFVAATENVDYIYLPIHVRAVGINKVSVETIEITGADTNWKSDASFKHANGVMLGENVTYQMSAKNGARVGLIDTKADSTPFVYQLGNISSDDLTANSSNTAYVGTDVPQATVTGSGTPPVYDTAAVKAEASNGQESYFVEKTDGIYMRAFNGYPTKVLEAKTNAADGLNVLSLTEGGDYYTGTMDLFVWFEGFDYDTYDAIAKMPLSVKLLLKGTPVE